MKKQMQDLIVLKKRMFDIVEFNCINASGFYDCDVEKVVLALTKYVRDMQ